MGSGKTSTSTSTTSIPQSVLDRYNSVNTTAQAAAQTPFQQYSTDPNAFVAPLSATQNAGIQGTNAAAGQAQPYFGAATGLTLAGGQSANPEALNTNQYMNPYLNSVVGATEAQMQNQNQQQSSALQGSAIGAGAFGGDRSGIAQGNLANQQSLANNQVISGLLNQGYTQAQGVAQQQQGVDLSAQQANLARLSSTGQQLAGLGSQAQTSALQGAAAQLTAGQQEQQTQQAGLSALYNQFLQQQSYPFQTAQFLANIAEGTGSLTGSTTSTTAPAPFFSDERLKEDIQKIGKTFDGQNIIKFRYKNSPQTHIGLSAQEVEKAHPRAVGLSGGYRTVDYDAATEHAAHRGHFNSGGLVPNSMGGAVMPMHADQHFADGGTAAGIDTTGLSPYGGASRFQIQPLQQRQLMQSNPVRTSNTTGLSQVKELMDMTGTANTAWKDGKSMYDTASSYFSQPPNSTPASPQASGGRVGFASGGLPYEDGNNDNQQGISGLQIPNQANQFSLKTPQNPSGTSQQPSEFKQATDMAKNIYGLGKAGSSIASGVSSLVAPAAAGAEGAAATSGAAGAAAGAGFSWSSLLPLLALATGGAAKGRKGYDDGGSTQGGQSDGGQSDGGQSNDNSNSENGGDSANNGALNDPTNYGGSSPAPSDYGSPAGVSATPAPDDPNAAPTPPVRPLGLGIDSTSGTNSIDSQSFADKFGVASPFGGLLGNSADMSQMSPTDMPVNAPLPPERPTGLSPNPFGDLSGAQVSAPSINDQSFAAGFNSTQPFGGLTNNSADMGQMTPQDMPVNAPLPPDRPTGLSPNPFGDLSPSSQAPSSINDQSFASGVNSSSPFGGLTNNSADMGQMTPQDMPVNAPLPPQRPTGLTPAATNPSPDSVDGNNLNPEFNRQAQPDAANSPAGLGASDYAASNYGDQSAVNDMVAKTLLAEGMTTDPSSGLPIANVLANRADASGEPIQNVIAAPKQISAWNTNNGGLAGSGGPNDPLSMGPDTAGYDQALKLAQQANSGTLPSDPTNGALFYAQPGINGLSSQAGSVAIGNHIYSPTQGGSAAFRAYASGGVVPRAGFAFGGDPSGDSWYADPNAIPDATSESDAASPADATGLVPDKTLPIVGPNPPERPNDFGLVPNSTLPAVGPVPPERPTGLAPDSKISGEALPEIAPQKTTGASSPSALTVASKLAEAASNSSGTTSPSVSANAPRSVRNNNPGNIENSSFAQNQTGYKGSDGRFAIFDTPEAGAAAMDKLLAGYGAKGFNTPASIIGRWAPAAENGANSTSSYAATVAKELGVGPNDKIDMSDPAIRAKMAAAMAKVEAGSSTTNGSSAVTNKNGLVPNSQSASPSFDFSHPIDSATSWMGNQDNRNLALSILSGVGKMASSNSRYLGAAMLQGVGGAADQYASLQNQAANINQTKANTLLTGEQTRAASIANEKSSFQQTPTVNIMWLTTGPITMAEYIQRRQNGENLPLLGHVPSDAEKAAMTNGPAASSTNLPSSSAPAAAANPSVWTPPMAGAATAPAAGAAAAGPATNAAVAPNSPAALNYDDDAKRRAQKDQPQTLAGGPNAEAAMNRSAAYAAEVSANAQAARNSMQNNKVSAITLANAASNTGWSTAGAGASARAAWINTANTLSHAFGGEDFSPLDTQDQILGKLNTLSGAMNSQHAGQASNATFTALQHANPNLEQNPKAAAELTSRVFTNQQRAIDQENFNKLYGSDSNGNYNDASSAFESKNSARYDKEAHVLQTLMTENPKMFSSLMSGQYSSAEIDAKLGKKYGVVGISRYFNGGS